MKQVELTTHHRQKRIDGEFRTSFRFAIAVPFVIVELQVGFVDIRVVEGYWTDEQRCGTRVASRRSVAQDELWNDERIGKSFRGTCDEYRGTMPSAEAKRVGIPHRLLDIASPQSESAFTLPSDSQLTRLTFRDGYLATP